MMICSMQSQCNCKCEEENKLNFHFFFLFFSASQGNFLNYLCQLGALHERSIADFVKQILTAIDYLHSKGLVHLDIKVI